MYRFPCVHETAEYHRISAHEGIISSVQFSCDGAQLVSIGKLDRCIVQWNCQSIDSQGDLCHDQYQSDDDLLLQSRKSMALVSDFMAKESTAACGILNDLRSNKPPREFLGKKNFMTPIHQPISTSPALNVNMSLNHVYGYSSQIVRNAVKYCGDGSVLYPCATLCVKNDRVSNSQSFFRLHTDGVSAVAMSASRTLAATAQWGHNASIIIWDSINLESLKIIDDRQSYSVCAISFSSDEKKIAVVNADDYHSISVYDWRSDLLLFRAHGGSCHISSLIFSHVGDELFTFGEGHACAWKIHSSVATLDNLILGKQGELKCFTCCATFNNMLLAGATDGSLYIFNSSCVLEKSPKAHDGYISAVAVSLTNAQFATGGKDATVRVWNISFDCVHEISCRAYTNIVNPRAKSVAFNNDGGTILLGSKSAEIFEIDIRSNSMIGEVVVSGHSCRELWGLSTHPSNKEFATVGDDCILRLWDSKSKKLVDFIRLDCASRFISYSPCGRYLALGFSPKDHKSKQSKFGGISVLTTHDRRFIHHCKDTHEAARV